MYARASPFSLALAMPVRDQVLSFLSELKERSREQEPTGRDNRNCKMVDMDRILHCNGSRLVASLLVSFGFA